jgi:hypothetical protein
MDENIKENHPSYGMINIGHPTGGSGSNLFGSAIKHNSTVKITINHAEKIRNLNRYWYHPIVRKPIVEIEMSPTQFAELLTTTSGTGVPCTLMNIEGQRVEDCPEVNDRELFEQEFKDNAKELMKVASDLAKDVKELFATKKTVNKKDRECIISKIDCIMREIKSNIPFVQSQFNESVENTITEATASIDHFVESKIRSLGLEALAEDVKKALAPSQDSPMLTAKIIDEDKNRNG